MKRFLFLRGIELAFLVLLAAIPFFINNPFALGLLTLVAIYGILLIGLDITVGYLGQINLAQAAFLGIGAYTAGLLSAKLGLPLMPSLAGSFLLCLALGSLLALPALRLEGPQFALATLSFLALTTTVLNEWESLTKGAEGLSLTRPLFWGSKLNAPGFYWLCLGLLALVWMGMRNLLSSQWGRAFEALRDSPIATDAMGIGTYRHKVIAFGFGSALGGLAGGLYGFNFQYLQPQTFVYELMVILLLGVVLGGRKSLWGACVGAALVVLLPNLLSNRNLFQVFSVIGLALALIAGIRSRKTHSKSAFQTLAPIFSMSLLAAGSFWVTNTEDWRKAIFALMLFSVVVGLPDGLMGFTARVLARLLRIPPATLPAPCTLDEVLPLQASSGKALLETRSLKRHFGGVKAVDEVSLTVQSGHIHGLIGPNGSGKSTVVNLISGLYTPDAGEMLLNAKALPTGSLLRTAQTGVARTFQNLQLFSELSALHNVMAALFKTYHQPWPLVMLGFSRQEERRAQAKALALLELVGLADRALVKAKDLPYGAQRFLEIARALARQPQLLILDEPAAGLSHPDIQVLIKIIEVIHSRGITMVLIEHHMDIVCKLCNTVTVLDSGRIIAQGTPDRIKNDPLVVQAYLGDTTPATGEPHAQG